MIFNPLFFLLANALSLTGVSLLFLRWKKILPPIPLWLIIGWSCLFLSGYCWIQTSNAEIGTVLSLLVPTLFAWIAVLINWKAFYITRKTKAKSTKTLPENSELGLTLPGLRPALKNTLLFFLVVPFAAIASTFLAVFIGELLPWQEINRMVTSVYLMPFIWGCCATWIIADTRILRPVISLLLTTCLCGYSLLS